MASFTDERGALERLWQEYRSRVRDRNDKNMLIKCLARHKMCMKSVLAEFMTHPFLSNPDWQGGIDKIEWGQARFDAMKAEQLPLYKSPHGRRYSSQQVFISLALLLFIMLVSSIVCVPYTQGGKRH